jgi:cysteine/glycine-rich protein
MAEQMLGAGLTWHKGCFNCISCNKRLDSTTMNDKDGQIYCKGCYGREFGPKGVGFGVGGGTLQT